MKIELLILLSLITPRIIPHFAAQAITGHSNIPASRRDTLETGHYRKASNTLNKTIPTIQGLAPTRFHRGLFHDVREHRQRRDVCRYAAVPVAAVRQTYCACQRIVIARFRDPVGSDAP